MDSELKRLYRILKTVYAMMAERGYRVNDEKKNLTFESFKNKHGSHNNVRQELTTFFAHEKGRSEGILVFFANEPKVGVKTLRSVGKQMDDQKVNRAILVVIEGLTPFAKTALNELRSSLNLHIETFSEIELLVNIMEHVLVPQHVVLDDDEKKGLLARYKCKETQLPRMQLNDPVSRFLGLARGQALFKYRLRVEVEYFLALWESAPSLRFSARLKDANSTLSFKEVAPKLRNVYVSFSTEDCMKIKEFEKVTNHDVKAVEYFLKEKMVEISPDLSALVEFVHFALTSQDINNTAVPLSIKEAVEQVYLPLLDATIAQLRELGERWVDKPMLARTHGQPATPTRIGKELLVFVERVQRQRNLLAALPFSCKLGGATGAFNAHVVACPEEDWPLFADRFTRSALGLERQQFTTQIEHYDGLGAIFDTMKRINTVLIDLSRDVWQYISLDYFKQRTVATETGSSTMPHKVNPIDFENAEGNLGLANCLFEHFSSKLPVSRLQRDLSDSTVLRNVGVPFGHTLVALQSLSKGLGKLVLNEEALLFDLRRNWAILAEPIQTVLRKEGFEKPYEALKQLTRGSSAQSITQETLATFIKSLSGVSQSVKEQLLLLTPETYIGVLPKASLEEPPSKRAKK